MWQDPNLGFSFQYPSNWLVHTPSNQTSTDVVRKGTYISIESYGVKGNTKGNVPKNAVKINIEVNPSFAKYESIDRWFSVYQKSQVSSGNGDSTFSMSEAKHSVVANIDMIRWTQQGSGEPGGGIYGAFGKDNWLYFVAAYPGNTEYTDIVEKIFSSFNIQ